jgi:hypothetical protein
MAPRIRTREGPPRRPLDLSRGYFYPGEVVRILKLEGVDYRQLRRLFKIVREQAGSPVSEEDDGWSQYTFRDLVAIKAALELAGGKEALSRGRRLRLQVVKEVCLRLRGVLGLSSPLTEILFRRMGRAVIAQVQGLLFDPSSGQLLLTEVVEVLERYLAEDPFPAEGARVEELRARVAQEARAIREALPAERRSENPVEVSLV